MEKNIFVHQYFLSLNIQILVYFLHENCNPPRSHQPCFKNEGPVKPSLFENLVGDWTRSPCRKDGGGDNTSKGVRLVIKLQAGPLNFTKNEHLIISSRNSDLYWSIKICPWQFFFKVRIIFDIFFQLNLFLKVSLIFVKNYVDTTFSNRFYILYYVHQRKNIWGGMIQ